MLSGYSCFCRDAPVASRLGLAEAVLCGEGASRVPVPLPAAWTLRAARTPPTGRCLRARWFASPLPVEAAWQRAA